MSESSGPYLQRDPNLNTSVKLFSLGVMMLVALGLSLYSDPLIRQIPILLLGMLGAYSFLIATQGAKNRGERDRCHLEKLKTKDNLTGLSNRQLFLSTLYSRARSPEYQNTPFALVLVDIDRFKELDTILGTENGDLLLQEFAIRLQHFQRDPKLVARLSGNEFAILLDDIGASSDFPNRIEILHAYLKQSYRFHGRPIDITVSGGFVLFPDHGYRTANLLQHAKMALLRAKQEGRDQVCMFEQRQDVRAHIDHELSQEMGKSIANREFCLHYQGQFCLQTGRQVGFEALMRWNHPTRGWISPGTFIPLAERNGLILPLSDYALREACRRAASWRQPLKVAVNLSPIQFQKSDLVPNVARILEETGLPPERLELEVTESLFIQTSQRTIETLNQLRAMGISIALDDFGTGYSSLSYLSAFPIDKIKLDRSFVRDLNQSNGNMAIISAVIGIGKSLDISITAEGIEDKETMEMLRIAGCHHAQGFLLDRPHDLAQAPGFEMTEPEPNHESEMHGLKLIRNPHLCA
ncbi:bifunctional diguanylate cyclase/phosphodiesterase [Cohaesibacter sp. CAU 1516]|uniref:putative bifunctional diguanylate cyclase/phosphodiesterase n=1 Tax=Cohaesibacter sp. CAU 1516 TaxID=2576038 RepID=UPI0010FE6F60|nr:bifunctional diguanylate cyclase/phosphodiesterase [Cohaesibacter sp. CAU 1516]TLP47185.1 bifunctional diguanylate cyclase/phosphodiesterase [Cohaesibacter sp. CAU 1516]